MSHIDDLMPHGQCFLWKPELVWLHTISDGLIALSYYSIPLALGYFVYKRRDLPFNWMFLMFGAFILACGTTHIMGIWTIWNADYWLDGAVKVATAGVSLATAGLLWPLIPKALTIPGPAQLEAANQTLKKEIAVRKQAEETLQESHALLRAVTEGSTDAIFVKDLRGRYLMINSSGALFLGRPVADIIRKDDTELFEPETARSIRERDRYIMTVGATETFEESVTTSVMTRTYLSVKGPFRNQNGQVIGLIGISRDITERKRLEQELERLAKDRLLLLESTDEGIYGVDLLGRCTFINKAAASMLGYPPEELTGKTAHEILHHSRLDGSPYPREECPIYGAFTAERGCRLDSEVFWKKDGTPFPVEYSSHPTFEDGVVKGSVVVFTDITDRKQAEEIRTQFLEKVLSAQEEERKRIAQELHDETGQSLTALLVGLRQLDDAPSLEEARTHTQELRKLTAKTMDEVNRLAVGLRPRVLDDLGLEAALKQYAEDFSRIHGVTADVLSSGLTERRLPDAVETALFRIVQEALTNIAKHARARTVSILVRGTPSEVWLIVEDDGCGFGANEVLKTDRVRKHLGIHGMQKRATLLNGSFSVESSPARGTTISAEIPLTGAQHEASSRHSR